MKKTLILLALLLNISSISFAQQTVQNLTTGGLQVVDNKEYFQEQEIIMPGQNGVVEPQDMSFLNMILSKDVFSYFRLHSTYKTDLEKELFKQSDEYRHLSDSLVAIRKVLMSQSCFYMRKLEKNYNVEKKGFVLEKEIYERKYHPVPGYFLFNTLSIEYATKRFSQNRINVEKRFGGRDYFYNQSILLPVADTKIALEIEAAKREGDAMVLFLFKLDSVKEFGWDKVLITKTQSIYIVNKSTGEVYCKVL